MTHAIVVRFTRPVEPYSDEEGLVPGRVEDAGYDRGGTLVSRDRREVVVTVRNQHEDEGNMDKLLRLLADGWDPLPIIHKDIACAPGLLQYEGPRGQPVEGIERVEFTEVDTAELCFSAAIAAREAEEI